MARTSATGVSLEELERRSRRGALDAAGNEALAEACFRRATAAGTPAADAIHFLRRAVRLDGTNPKHAYFLARLFFQYGDFRRAGRWLTVAARACPTSHRIWTHVALLQRELNSRYRGDDAFEADDLRRKGTEILRRIRLGIDEFPAELLAFEPRESGKKKHERALRKRESGVAEASSTDDEPAQDSLPGSVETIERFSSPDTCRWSGAVDLALEEVIESAPSKLTLERAQPLLDRLVRTAAARRGGAAAFAIAAIQWCIAGYPLAAVARARRIFPAELDAPSLRLLDLVYTCLRLPPAEVSARLARALDQGMVPRVLAALLHHRCLTRNDVDARVFAKHAAGRRWLERHGSEGDDAGGCAELVRALEQTASGLDAGAQPRSEEAPEPMAVPTDWLAAFALIEDAARRVAQLDEEVRTGSVCASEDPGAWSELVNALSAAAERASSRLDDLLAAAHGVALSREGHARARLCRRALNQVLYASPPRARRLGPRGDPPASPDAPVQIAAWKERAESVLAVAELGTGTPASRLTELEVEAAAWSAQLDDHRKTLIAYQAAIKKSPPDPQALAECPRIAEVVGRICGASGERIREIAGMREGGKLRGWSAEERLEAEQRGRTLPASDIDRLASVEKVYRENAARQGPFRRQLAQLSLPKPTPVALSEAGRDVPSAPSGSTPVAARADDTAGRLPLQRALSRLGDAVEARCVANVGAFAAYRRDQLDDTPLAALCWSARARLAEALFRVDRRDEARRVWYAMSSADRTSVPVLKNIALAHTNANETGRELRAWRDYAEMLYYLDCTEGTVRARARARIELHRHFGSSCADEGLLTQRRDVELSEAHEMALVSFLESTTRVRAFVAHKRLEWLNRKLDFTHPSLVLGCNPNEADSVRSAARAALLEFVGSCCADLPPRVAGPFERAATRHVEDAYSACKDLRRSLAQPAHKDELERQKAWVRDVTTLKEIIAQLLLNSKHLVRRMTTVDFLGELARLDEVPVDLSPRYLADVHPNTELLRGYMGVMRDNFLARLAEFLSEQGAGPEISKLRERQFERLLGEWLPAVYGSMPLIHLFVERAEEAAATGRHESVIRLMLAVLRTDAGHPNVAQLALTHYLTAVESLRRRSETDEVAHETEAWLARARTRLAAKKPDDEDLTSEAIDEVADRLAQVLLGACLAPHIALRPGGRVGIVERALEECVRRYPETRPYRMLKYVEFANEAINAGLNEEGRHWIGLCKVDLESVLADASVPARLREYAEKLSAQLAASGA